MSTAAITPELTGYTIPLLSQNQSLNITLGGVQYTLYIYWCAPSQTWNFDLSDASGNLILGGRPLVTGIDLLQQFQYLNLGGALVVQTAGQDALAPPTFTNLGTDANLLYVTTS
jgi:hypothetical protein